MNAAELQALRRLLFFSVAEAARYVAADAQRPGGVEERTWNRWEAGKVPIPANVAQALYHLVAVRESRVQDLKAMIRLSKATELPLVLPWYDDIEDWVHPRSLMRPIQSAHAAVASVESAMLRLVPFDGVAYARWARDRKEPGFEPQADIQREQWCREQLAAQEGASPPEVF